MSRGVGAGLLVFVWVAIGQSLSARPEYLDRFQSDPLRRPEVDGCSTCHVAATGGGARNEFGTAFEAAALQITPLLRASFPQHFKFESVKLADGTVLAFSDPQSKLVVVERRNERFAAELATLTAVRAAPLPAPANRMSFFVTSEGPSSFEQLGGLAGADRHCQTLAKAVGADDRTWRAYLSTSFHDKPAINAGDRIGSGPWYNAKGVLLARGPADLHAMDRFRPDVVLTEKGDAVSAGTGAASVKVATGSLANGTAAVGKNCGNWTAAGAGDAMAADTSTAWNSGTTISCDLNAARAAAAKVLLYCFASK